MCRERSRCTRATSRWSSFSAKTKVEVFKGREASHCCAVYRRTDYDVQTAGSPAVTRQTAPHRHRARRTDSQPAAGTSSSRTPGADPSSSGALSTLVSCTAAAAPSPRGRDTRRASATRVAAGDARSTAAARAPPAAAAAAGASSGRTTASSPRGWPRCTPAAGGTAAQHVGHDNAGLGAADGGQLMAGKISSLEATAPTSPRIARCGSPRRVV